MPRSDLSLAVVRLQFSYFANEKHLQKTMQILTECEEAAAQAWVLFFYLLTGML